MTAAAVWALLKPFILPLLAFVAGWVFPSPLERAAKKQEEVHDAEKKFTDSRGNVGDLDNLP